MPFYLKKKKKHLPLLQRSILNEIYSWIQIFIYLDVETRFFDNIVLYS